MKLMVCNIGWCKEYQGDRVHGKHKFIRKTKGDGSERWNFKTYRDRTLKGYFRGIGKNHALPHLPDTARDNWTIVFYAQDPTDKILKIVGFYRSARILPDWEERPENISIRTLKENHCYCVVAPAKKAKLFPEKSRPRFGKGLGQVGFVYLTDLKTQRVKPKYKTLYKKLSAIVKNPSGITLLGQQSDSQHSPTTIDPLHREAVEKASMSFVKKQLRREGYQVTDVSDKNLGYDLRASRGADILYVEVKGTAGSKPRFIITKNEVSFMGKDPSSRIGIVTTALTQPKLHVLKGFNLEMAFNLRPLQLEATPRSNSSYMITGVKKFFCLP